VELRSLDRLDIGMLFAAVAVGSNRKLFVTMILRAIINERGLDVQVIREGHGFVLVGTETAGDVIVAEHSLPVAWANIGEDVRLGVLGMYVAGLLEGHDRWQHRMARVPLPRSAAND
jgi:hypothetical protein